MLNPILIIPLLLGQEWMLYLVQDSPDPQLDPLSSSQKYLPFGVNLYKVHAIY